MPADAAVQRPPAASRGGAWGFVCGRIAAREAELQPRAFFDGLLRAQNAADIRQALGKTVYRPLFAHDDAVRDAATILTAYFAEARGDILSLCPPHPIKAYFELSARYRSFRTLFNQRAKQAHPDELEALFRALADDEAYARALAEHRAMVFRKDAPQQAGPLERSLYLDSVACTLIDLFAQATPEPLARRFLHDRAVLAAWAAILRARWSQAPAETVRTWFVFGDDRSMASAFLAGEAHPAQAVASFVSAEAGRALAAMDPAHVRADVDAASANALRDTVLACRLVTAGAERVLSYLVALEAEAVNLQLCVTAVMNDMDREQVAARLRKEYA